MEHDPNAGHETNEIDPIAGADDIVVAQKGADGKSDVVPLASHLAERTKAEKRGEARARESLQQEIQQAAAVKAQLEEWAPILQRIQQDPTILTRAQQPRQAVHEEDVEARELAEDMGFIDQSGSLDVGRARRVLNRIESRNGKQIDQRMAPLAATTAGQMAQHHRMTAKQARMKDGVTPVASEESIDQVFAMLPAELLADRNVASLMPIMAAGLDKMLGRTAKAPTTFNYGDPIFTEAAGGGRRPGILTDQDKAFAKQVGVKEEWLAEKSQQLANNGRRGVALE
jgi:hypothetical protein